MIDFNKTRQYTLSIRLSTDGFCFSVHNPSVSGEYAYQPYAIDPMKSVVANLKTAVTEVEMLRHHYGTVNVIVPDAPYTLVPGEYFAESCLRDIYMQNFPSTTKDTLVMHNVVADEQIVVLFGIDQKVYQFLAERYPKVRVCSHVTPLIELGMEKSAASPHRYFVAHLHGRQFDVLCFAGELPLFVNTFEHRDNANTLYFLLNCWQMLGLSQTDDTLYLAGTARGIKALVKELEKFIANVRLVRPAEEFHATELARIGDMPFDLQALVSCE